MPLIFHWPARSPSPETVISASRKGARMPNARTTSSSTRSPSSSRTRAMLRPISAPRGAPSTQAIGSEIFEKAERQGPPRHGASGRCAQILVDVSGLCANGFQRLADDRAGAARTGARDEVDQLPPADRGVVAIAGRLIQHCEQAIVETHLGQFPSKHRSPALGHGLLGAKRESV